MIETSGKLEDGRQAKRGILKAVRSKGKIRNIDIRVWVRFEAARAKSIEFALTFAVELTKGELMGDYDDERPDWREIDRKKDRSRMYGGPEERGPRRDKPRDRYKTGKWEKALDKLFMGKKGTIEHEKLYGKIHSSYGTGRFPGVVAKYIKEYGLPEDISTLLLVIDTKEETIIFPVIDRIGEIYSGLTSRQKEDARRKLSILKLTDKSPGVKEKAGEVLETITCSLSQNA